MTTSIYDVGYDAAHPGDFIYDISDGHDFWLLILTQTPAEFWVQGASCADTKTSSISPDNFGGSWAARPVNTAIGSFAALRRCRHGHNENAFRIPAICSFIPKGALNVSRVYPTMPVRSMLSTK